jgi:hypothetical protein
VCPLSNATLAHTESPADRAARCLAGRGEVGAAMLRVPGEGCLVFVRVYTPHLWILNVIHPQAFAAHVFDSNIGIH